MLVNPMKTGYAKRRPYLDQPLPNCEPMPNHLAQNGDYAPGHTSSVWSTALVLAEFMPDRTTAILTPGRAFGESRYICTSHSGKSAVEAGFMAGTVAVSVLHASPEFRTDMGAAHAEFARSHASIRAPAQERCGLEE